MSSYCEECRENRRTIEDLNFRLDTAYAVVRAAEAFKKVLESEGIKAGNRTLEPLRGEAKIWNNAIYRVTCDFNKAFEDVNLSLAEWDRVLEALK